MTRLRICCEDLRPGDVLTPTNRHVLANRGRGVRTPAGKVDLTLQRKGEPAHPATFGRYTIVTVLREETE